MALLAFVAVFALTFTGCKKSDSNNSGGDTPTPTPPPAGNYGTITVAGQEYTIAIGMYHIEYNEDIHANFVTIVLADRIGQNANLYSVSIPYQDNIPLSTFNYSIQVPTPQGSCRGLFSSNGNALLCIGGNITISQVNGKYKIESSGSATDTSGQGLELPFEVDFEGPLTEEN